MKTTKQLLGQRIKELRKLRGLSQDELSEKVGIDPKHGIIMMVERSLYTPE